MNTSQGGWSNLPPRGDHNRTVFLCMAAGALLFAVVSAVSIVIVAQDLSKDFIGTAVAAPDTPPPAAVPVSAGIPASVTENGAVRVGDPNAKTVVRVVADLQCPACKAFEKANAKVLEDAVTRGTAVVEYNIISFLDRASTTQYSSRAANASYCVAEFDPSKYQTWFAAMFDQQPEEGGDGLADTKLIEIAQETGYADPAVAQCITDRKYDAFLRTKTKEIIDSGVKSTPSVFINGQPVADGQQLFITNGLAPAIR